ncbi:hypothetical protein SK803_22825 [Lentzea sp. BCCO 10_0856]|uniref:Lipoprotein n=1 Tax=Lentzea miocenica TaxID=3095431 RepID=A0ABU4T4G1_9PSEU|nr:hypothetical protein [Lentzea sp. BCCO 10_0856]MDX8033061.1 hypothetical protein [Lentzea sp. BCCO 10_0856]
MNNKVVSAIALVIIGAVLFGLCQRARAPGVNVRIPFAGTPAEQWQDGEKGIGVPNADPLYERVRQALIASRTDPVMISEHRPDRFLTMLAPDVRDEVARDLPGWTTRLKTGTKLLGIKVSGQMTLGEKNGYPAVLTDYVFAYAFEPPDPAELTNQMEMVAASRQQVTFTVTPEGLWPSDAMGFQYSIACRAARDGFLAPQFTEPAEPGGGVAKDDRKYFSTDGRMPSENTCD